MYIEYEGARRNLGHIPEPVQRSMDSQARSARRQGLRPATLAVISEGRT